jgi:hypothetical protein
VLAAKPYDVFFLASLPVLNLDNKWNEDILRACEEARRLWVKASSRREENTEGYMIQIAKDPDAFPEPKWPKQSLGELVKASFEQRMITAAEHPALARLIGAKVKVA